MRKEERFLTKQKQQVKNPRKARPQKGGSLRYQDLLLEA